MHYIRTIDSNSHAISTTHEQEKKKISFTQIDLTLQWQWYHSFFFSLISPMNLFTVIRPICRNIYGTLTLYESANQSFVNGFQVIFAVHFICSSYIFLFCFHLLQAFYILVVDFVQHLRHCAAKSFLWRDNDRGHDEEHRMCVVFILHGF